MDDLDKLSRIRRISEQFLGIPSQLGPVIEQFQKDAEGMLQSEHPGIIVDKYVELLMDKYGITEQEALQRIEKALEKGEKQRNRAKTGEIE
jgi:hypothetical protein